mgnify:CR=1 FL=1
MQGILKLIRRKIVRKRVAVLWLGLVAIEPVNRVRIVEHQAGKLERDPVRLDIPLGLAIIPFEFVVRHGTGLP